MPRTQYGDDFLDFVYGQQSDFKNFGGFDDILGVTDLPTDPASQRMLAKRYMDLQKGGEGVSYRDFARQVLGMGTGGGQGGR